MVRRFSPVSSGLFSFRMPNTRSVQQPSSVRPGKRDWLRGLATHPVKEACPTRSLHGCSMVVIHGS